MAIIATGIGCQLGGLTVLDRVDIEVSRGEVLAVLGPNGAGKSSLLRILCGELNATEGAVLVAGRPLNDWQNVERARMLAMLPQGSQLNFPFTAREVVSLGRTPHDTGLRRDRQIVDAALDDVDMTAFADREYTRLSGGERQRVQLARILAQIATDDRSTPRYLLLDEPTASLDLAHQALTLQVITRLAAEGVAVVVVLHDLNLAARCASQMLLLRAGRVAASGSPQAVLNSRTIADVFDVQATVTRHPRDGKQMVIT